MATDPYEVLGVARDAPEEDIKKAYRKIAKENHPDLNPGDAAAEARFKEASQAWDILRNAETRARYDRGEIDAAGQERPEAHFYRPHAEAEGGGKYHRYETFGDFADAGGGMGGVFDDLFGAGARRRGGGFERGGQDIPWPGADIRYSMEVGFLEAARGGKKRVTMPDGRTLDISIPQGVRDGQVIRLRGQGGKGSGGGPDGDALVTIAVEPHPQFTRSGNDIEITVPVTLREAVLGAKIRVPTIEGPVTLTVPEGSTTGDVLRLKGRGIKPAGKAAAGNQLVRLEIQLPESPDPALRAFLEDQPADDWNPRQGMEA